MNDVSFLLSLYLCEEGGDKRGKPPANLHYISDLAGQTERFMLSAATSNVIHTSFFYVAYLHRSAPYSSS